MSRGAVWGLTGGVASGKSSAARFFSELGIPVVDADEVSRRLSASGGAAHAPIVSRFGTADREKLRELVFSDPSARKDLEAILHPLIIQESERELERRLRETGAKAAIYEASLLVESGRHRQLAGLVVIDSPRELRLARLISRNGFSPELAEKILSSQISDDARRKAASFVIDNSGTLDELRTKVQAFAQERGWI